MAEKEDYFSYNKKGESNMGLLTIVFLSIGVFIFGLIISALFMPDLGDFVNVEKEKSVFTCGDGTFNNTCSLDKPYYCEEGFLVRDASLCGCSEFMNKREGMCTSKYETEQKEVTLDYVLEGERKNISLTVYGGLAEHLHGKDKNIFYAEGEKISRRDFKLNAINGEIQKQYVLPLVKKIQNLAPNNKVEQARIAVNLVQHIPYGSSGESVELSKGNDIEYSRYPYEVLYDNEGICGEKTELMALLLKELGYGTAFFYYPLENHEALGVKCPVEESFQSTGYCFVETTMPAIISDSELQYKGVGKLSDNVEIYLLSEGISLPEDIYEYEDREKLQDIKDSGMFNKKKYEDLKEKYGLGGEYRVE